MTQGSSFGADNLGQRASTRGFTMLESDAPLCTRCHEPIRGVLCRGADGYVYHFGCTTPDVQLSVCAGAGPAELTITSLCGDVLLETRDSELLSMGMVQDVSLQVEREQSWGVQLTDGECILDRSQPLSALGPPGSAVVVQALWVPRIVVSGMVYIRAQSRNGRNTWTTVCGFPEEVRIRGKAMQVNSAKILRAIKKTFRTNGVVIRDVEHGPILQLLGDLRSEVAAFLIEKTGIVTREQVMVLGT